MSNAILPLESTENQQYSQAYNKMLLSVGEGKEKKVQKERKDFQNFIRQTAETKSEDMI